MRMNKLLAGLAVVAIPAAALAQAGPRYLSQRDVAEAQRQHPELVEEFGGAETGARAAYVEGVGRRVAAFSGIANSAGAYRFTTLNSAVENAFAVPGGYVYITRQLLGLMDDEAELASVLGHEVGHIAADHSRGRQNRSILTQLGALAVGVLTGSGELAQIAGTVGQGLFLSYSREQEYEADTLGMRYMIAAGYDPVGAPGILGALTRNSALQARVQGRDNRQLPEWASTHPLSENRMQRAAQEGRATGRLGTGIRNRDEYLGRIDGIYVDDDPEQGIIEGRTFTHPDLRIYFAVPVGYLMQNGTRAVTISGSAGKAQFGGGRYSGSLENYVYEAIRELAGNRQLPAPRPQRTVINGIPAAYTVTRASTQSGVVDVSVVAYQWAPGTVYHFVMLTPGGSGMGQFASMVSSIRKISTAEAAAIRPRVIDVVTVAPGDAVQSLSRRMAYRNFQLDRFLTLNGLAPNARLAPGQKVKLVVYGARRS